MPKATNAQGTWDFYGAYDRTTRDFAVVVLDEARNTQIIGHAPHYLAAEEAFLNWIAKGHDATTGEGVQE